MTPIILISLFYFISIVACIKDRSIISPIFITPFMWGTILFLYYFTHHPYFELKGAFLLAIVIWVSTFFITGVIVDCSALIAHRTFREPNLTLRKGLFYTTIIFSPVALYLLYKDGISNGPEYLITRLRQINTGQIEGEINLGPLVYIFNIAFCSLLIEITEFDNRKSSILKIVILGIVNFLLCLVTLAKTMFIFLTISIFSILYFQSKIKFKHFIGLIITITFLLTALTLLRMGEEGQESSVFSVVNETFQLYVFSPLPAFESLSPNSEIFGGNTFRFLYVLIKGFGINKDVSIYPTILEWTSVPIETNIYTILYPFYKDFSFTGIFVFAIIYGFFSQLFFKLAYSRNKLSILIFSYLMPAIILQFMGEFLFTNLSNTIQCIFLFSSIYLIKNRNDP